MVRFNKYLERLGLKETDYPFNVVEGDERYLEDEDGFRDCEFFSLDYSLSLYIYSQLCYFKEHCLYGVPCEFEPEDWEAIIDKMIEAFKLIITEAQVPSETMHLSRKQKIIESKNREKKIKYGLRLFVKYFRHLWY